MIDGHGDDSYKYGDDIKINFSSNVYNHISHDKLFDYLRERMPMVQSYPEPMPYSLEKKIAEKFDINADNVCVTNGATEAIYLIAQTMRRNISTILTPTFSEYADACRLHEHKIISVYSLEQISEGTKIVWICNPNNPTGEVIDKSILKDYITKFPNCYFVIDQSYEYFTTKELLTAEEALEYPNVILIHSMTKHFAIPGLRLGYITANAAVLNEFKLQRMPWSVNTLAIEAARFLIDNEKLYNIDLNHLLDERRRVEKAFENTGVMEIWPSDTHFMLVKLRISSASVLKEYLAKEHKILIRDASNFYGLTPQHFRIAVQRDDENDELIKAVYRWLEL